MSSVFFELNHIATNGHGGSVFYIRADGFLGIVKVRPQQWTHETHIHFNLMAPLGVLQIDQGPHKPVMMGEIFPLGVVCSDLVPFLMENPQALAIAAIDILKGLVPLHSRLQFSRDRKTANVVWCDGRFQHIDIDDQAYTPGFVPYDPVLKCSDWHAAKDTPLCDLFACAITLIRMSTGRMPTVCDECGGQQPDCAECRFAQRYVFSPLGHCALYISLRCAVCYCCSFFPLLVLCARSSSRHRFRP